MRGIEIVGRFRLEVRERGKLVGSRVGRNICTQTGREFIAESLALAAFSPRTRYRLDSIAYLGLGTGSQPSVASITSLVEPIPYATGEFLAPVQVPATFPTPTLSRTAVQFIREYGRDEISLGGATVVLTEAGLFSDGDPDDNWSIDATPTDFATTSSRAPFFYKGFDPLPITSDRTAKIIWEVRIA
jgi:hypothetical protein